MKTVKLLHCSLPLLCSALSVYLSIYYYYYCAKGCNPRSMDLGRFCKNELYKTKIQLH